MERGTERSRRRRRRGEGEDNEEEGRRLGRGCKVRVEGREEMKVTRKMWKGEEGMRAREMDEEEAWR